MRYYLVGGAVRDLLLGIRPREFDIAFDGAVSDFLQASAKARKIGKGCPVYIAGGLEHTPLRAADLAGDLAKRDFTVNALALDANGILHALPQSFADLRAGIIRHAATEAFGDDPARVFRAARFAAILPNFRIHPETLELMREAAATGALCSVAAERVGRECMKALAGNRPALFFSLLAEADALSPWLQELEAARNVPAGPSVFHGGDSVFGHTLDVMEKTLRAADLPPEDRTLALWMALCHDLGKITTDPADLPRHVGHEKSGENAARILARRLRLPARWEKAGMLAARLHMKGGNYPALRPGTRVDLLHSLHAARLSEPFFAMAAADAGDSSIPGMARADLQRMLSVALPEAYRNRGSASAARLRELRALALAEIR